jgi:hypothetical protein
MTSAGVRRTAALTSIAGLVVSGVALASAPVGAAPGHAAAPSSKLISTYLQGVSVAPNSTTTFVYGVEQRATTSGYFIARRTGSHFTKLKVAKVGTSQEISGLAAGSSKSAFLIGSASTKTGSVPLLERSTGGAFHRVKVPKGVTQLESIAASSASNVWIEVEVMKTVKSVATYYNGLLRWNGHSWHLFLIPKAVFGTSGSPSGRISTSGPSSTWFILNTGTTKGTESVRFTGHSYIKKPIKLPTNADLGGLAAGSAKSVWAYGTSSTSTGQHPFTEHFTGKSWHLVKVPPVSYLTTAQSIAAAGSKAYLVGSYSPKKAPKAGYAAYAFAMTFKGGKWHTVSHVKRGVTSGLNYVAASSKLAVASGTSYNGYQCVANVKGTGYLVSIRSTSGSISLSPTLRTPRLAPAIGFTPSRPSC